MTTNILKYRKLYDRSHQNIIHVLNFSNENNFLKTSESFLTLKPIIN
jgi:hypothetical protein